MLDTFLIVQRKRYSRANRKITSYLSHIPARCLEEKRIVAAGCPVEIQPGSLGCNLWYKSYDSITAVESNRIESVDLDQ